MQLRKYMDAVGYTISEFAKMIDVSPTAMAHYYYGRRVPKLAIAIRIEKLTKGKVTIDDLLNAEPEEK